MVETSNLSHSNLFIKNIPPEVDEETLYSLFLPFGQVESCRVLKSMHPGTNTIGFVKFATVDMARFAIANMNGASVAGSVLEVRVAQQDVMDGKNMLTDKMASDNLYVKGFPSHWTEKDLKAMFEMSGKVDSCRILISREADKGGVGLVRMKSIEEATTAINMWNFKCAPGSNIPLSVIYADTSKEKERKETRKNSTKVQRYSPYQPKSIALTTAANPYPMQNTGIVKNELQNYPLNHSIPQLTQMYNVDMYGYPLDSNSHINYMQPNIVASYPPTDYSSYYSSLTQPTSMVANVEETASTALSGSASLYIRNLPKESDKLYLYEMFAPHGAIKSAAVLKDDEGYCRGIGFVNYAEQTAALRAIGALHGKKVGNVELQVSLQHKNLKKP